MANHQGALPVSPDWRDSVDKTLTRLVGFVDGNGEDGAKVAIKDLKGDVKDLCADLKDLNARTFGAPEQEGGLAKRITEIEKLMIQNQSIIKFGVFVMSALGLLIISLLFGIFTGEFSLIRNQ